MKAALIGGGVIGGGWAARFLTMGWDVAVADPDPGAEAGIAAVLDLARRSLPGLYDRPLPKEGALSVGADIAEAVAGADWIQESVPERLDLKRRVFSQIAPAAGPDAVIASSTSGFKPSELSAALDRPVIVAHPFQPVYLLPLVELVGDAATLDRAAPVLEGVGMFPLKIRVEIDAHVADRFLEAVWREALWLIKDGVATTEEIDEAIRMGFGLRWAQMGLFETYRLGGGRAGMRHFIQQFAPALKWPWTKLMDVPELDDALVEKIAGQSDAQSGGRSIEDLMKIRDAGLVSILRGLKERNHAAGAHLNRVDARLPLDPGDIAGPLNTQDRAVPLDWTDYNGHMNEARYLTAFSQATDRFLELAGCDAAYVAGGGSYFTVETHIRHLGEALAGDRIRVETQVVAAEGGKLHLFHNMLKDGEAIATGEHFLIHVDLSTRRPSPPGAAVAARLSEVSAAHAALPKPDGAGRAVGAPP